MRDNSLSSNVTGDVTSSSLPLAKLKILVVDDDEDSCFYISTVLEADGASVTTVASAAKALEVLPQLLPDVLICDIGMPDEDGYTLIGKIRELKAEKGGNVPAIALTAYADSEDRILALEAGFQIHIAKPVDPDNLVAAVANVLVTE
ncbi:MAG: response regulator [Pelatocladus maniniholoensis HA4357-MV3]|jgi:CheY-like chemotaxis protein|uniref:Response regulator n=1 Tax=Pelatocladus maniniholoensis HA4357-MV3 TaxID=1117104 RepID=A0A9E3H549_9NOST|nr:response regulator [Pelatocladus maniniholoensis HA4357-MV3]BAZ69494.1 response regulator receiver protein [Fischerella sp. NIES-4106]